MKTESDDANNGGRGRINVFLSLEEECLDLVVQNQDESSTRTADDIGQRSLEERFATLLFADLHPANPTCSCT